MGLDLKPDSESRSYFGHSTVLSSPDRLQYSCLMTTAYDEVLSRTKSLSSEERLRLADTLLEEELSFGMWQQCADVQDAAAYVERIRSESMRTPDNRLKTPDEFLKEVEAFDE